MIAPIPPQNILVKLAGLLALVLAAAGLGLLVAWAVV